MIRSPRRVVLFVLLTMTVAIGAACVSTNAPERTGLLAEAQNVTVNARQLIMRIDEFTGLWLGAVEFRADTIRAESSDPDVRRAALIWKINASSSMLRATSHSDPLSAFMDAWTLVFQYKDYFESGEGADMFGDHTDLARDLSDVALQEFERLAASVAQTAGVVRGRQIAAEFAAREPIANTYFLRRSVVDELIDGLPQETKDAFAALGSITQTVESLGSRLGIYIEHFPKQARWQAELLLEDPYLDTRLAGVLEGVDGINAAASQIAEIVEQSPALDERLYEIVAQVIAALHEEIEGLTAVVQSERELILGKLPAEYEALFAHVTDQRLAALADVEAKIDEVVAEVDAIASRTLSDAEGLAHGTVDYAIGRVTPILILAFLGILILILVYRFVPQRVRVN